jgi:predicted CXXCH cytochrome family protein
MGRIKFNKLKRFPVISGVLIVLISLLIFNFTVYAGSIVGSKHDLTAEWRGYTHAGYKFNDYKSPCVYCHVPHNSSSDGPLWNRPLPSAGAYTLYDSYSLDASISSVSTQSLLCMSCHDGTIAVDSVLNQPANYTESEVHNRMSRDTTSDSCNSCHDSKDLGVTEAFLTTDLSDDHPVSFTYDSTLATTDGELKDPSEESGLGGSINDVMLTNGKLECTSCHDVHDPDYVPFLIKSNSGSQLCTTCHIK